MSVGKRVKLSSGEVVLRLSKETAAALDRLERSDSGDFGALARAAGLDPARHFVGADLSGLPLGPSKSDLRGFNFSGADLRGTGLRDAVVDATTRVDGATLDEADRRVLGVRGVVGRRSVAASAGPFDLEKARAMILAGKAPPREWTPKITHLDFRREKRLSDLAPLADLTALQDLQLGETRVIDLTPLAGLTALQHLSLVITRVSDLAPLAGLTALRRLWLSDTPVSDLAPLAGLTALWHLSLVSTRVIDLAPLVGLSALQGLQLYGTQVSDLMPLVGLTALRKLWLTGTPANNLTPLTGLTALQRLFLGDTQVSDLAPLAGLTALQQLWLDSTPVNDLTPLAGLTALQELVLNNTPVSDLTPLVKLKKLRAIVVESEERRASLARTLRRRGRIVKVAQNMRETLDALRSPAPAKKTLRPPSPIGRGSPRSGGVRG